MFAITGQPNNATFSAITISSIAILVIRRKMWLIVKIKTTSEEGKKAYLCVGYTQQARTTKQANRNDPTVQLQDWLCTGQIKSTRLCHLHRKIALRKECHLLCMVCERDYRDSDTNAWRCLSCWEIVVLYYG